MPRRTPYRALNARQEAGAVRERIQGHPGFDPTGVSAHGASSELCAPQPPQPVAETAEFSRSVMDLASDTDLHHMVRLSDRIKRPEVKKVLFLLVTELYRRHGNLMRPTPRGNFSAWSFRAGERNCFEFRATKGWIGWYFRKPAFELGLADYGEVLSRFSALDPKEKPVAGEIWGKLRSPDEGRNLLEYVLKKRA